MNLGTVGQGFCLGGIFDLGLGSNIGAGGGNPSWVVGDTFLVRLLLVLYVDRLSRIPLRFPEKRVLCLPVEPRISGLRPALGRRRRLIR